MGSKDYVAGIVVVLALACLVLPLAWLVGVAFARLL